MALNYRVAKLEPRQRAMLDYAWKLTTTPWLVEDADRIALHAAGLSYAEIAAREGCTPRTVERQLLRARRTVREADRAC